NDLKGFVSFGLREPACRGVLNQFRSQKSGCQSCEQPKMRCPSILRRVQPALAEFSRLRGWRLPLPIARRSRRFRHRARQAASDTLTALAPHRRSICSQSVGTVERGMSDRPCPRNGIETLIRKGLLVTLSEMILLGSCAFAAVRVRLCRDRLSEGSL